MTPKKIRHINIKYQPHTYQTYPYTGSLMPCMAYGALVGFGRTRLFKQHNGSGEDCEKEDNAPW